MISEESYNVAKETAQAAGLAPVVQVLEGLWNQQEKYRSFFTDVHGACEAAARHDQTLDRLMKEG